MNILVLSWRAFGHPNAGGAEIATLEHAKAWVGAGHKVTLFTSSFRGATSRETVGGVNIIRSGGQTFAVKIKAAFWYLFGKHPRFDLVVDEFHGIPFFTPIYVRARKLAWIHEVAKEVWWFNPWPRPFNLIPAIVGTVFERFIFKVLYRNINFMTVSESTKGELVSWGIPKNNIVVVYNGVDKYRVRCRKESEKTAIYLGALARDKGVEDAIRTFGLIDQASGEWRLWVVGKGERDYSDKLKRLSEDLGVEKKVKFWGYVGKKKKFELLARAHVFINPSVREGWGLVNIEAAACGTPVIGYRVPGVRDSVVDGKTGMLVQKGDTSALARAAISLVREKKRYNKFSREAIKWAGGFSWKKAGKQSLAIIEA